MLKFVFFNGKTSSSIILSTVKLVKENKKLILTVTDKLDYITLTEAIFAQVLKWLFSLKKNAFQL